MNKATTKLAVLSCFSALTITANAGWLENVLLPKLTKEQTEWTSFQRDVDTSDPAYPLKVLSDGYKMISVSKVPAYKDKNNNVVRHSYFKVEWGWQLTVKNISEKDLTVTVNYRLMDADAFELAKSYDYQRVSAGATVTIQTTSTMDHDRLNRLAQSGWNISSR